MDAILQTLRELKGLNAALIADRRGRILACKADSVFASASQLELVSRTVVSAVDSVRRLHEDWESVTVRFAGGKLLIRSLSSHADKTHELTLSVITDTRLNWPFAGIAIRLAVAKLKAIVEAGAVAHALGLEALRAPSSPSVTAARLSLSPSLKSAPDGSAKGSAPDIDAKELAPALVAELEMYLERLTDAADSKNAAPKIP